ncbi:hypothetical protein HQ520_11470 [bacterium]|nr:hypothetical protein [bacterium]
MNPIAEPKPHVTISSLLRFLAFACLLFSLAALARGEGNDVKIIGFGDPSTPPVIDRDNATARIIKRNGHPAIEIGVNEPGDASIVGFSIPASLRDLSAKRYLCMEATNVTSEPLTMTCWALSDGWGGGVSTYSYTQAPSGRESFEPGQTRTLQIDLHARYDSTEWQPLAINPANVTRIEIVFQDKTAGPKLAMGDITATGVGPAIPYDTSRHVLVPEVTDGAAAPGKRVREVLSDYAGTSVTHVLYLPRDWQPGKSFPIIVEYTGNIFYHKFCHSTGLTDQGTMAYGLSKGVGYICLNLPFISEDGQREQKDGWGDPDRTADYCVEAVQETSKRWGGDPSAVFFVGFSRGTIAANYIALCNDRIASIWAGIIGDPITKPKGNGWRNSAEGWDERAARLGNTPTYKPKVILGKNIHVDVQFLEDRPSTLATRAWMSQIVVERATYAVSHHP